MSKRTFVSGYCRYCGSNIPLEKKEMLLENNQKVTIYEGICINCGKEIEEEIL